MQTTEINWDAVGGVEQATTQAKSLIKREIEQMIVSGDDYKARKNVHLSDVLSKNFCYRKMVFAACDYPQTPVKLSFDRIKVNAQGWDMHKRWQSWARRAGMSKGAEIEHIVKDWHLAFTRDDVWEFRDGSIKVVEIKGYDHTEVARILRTNNPPHDALVQVSCYCYLEGIPDWLILVESKGKILDEDKSKQATEKKGKLSLEFRKGTQEFFVWEGTYDPKIVEPYVVRLNTIKEMVKRHIESRYSVLHPGICKSPTDYTAVECPFREVCFMDAGARRERRIEQDAAM